MDGASELSFAFFQLSTLFQRVFGVHSAEIVAASTAAQSARAAAALAGEIVS